MNVTVIPKQAKYLLVCLEVNVLVVLVLVLVFVLVLVLVLECVWLAVVVEGGSGWVDEDLKRIFHVVVNRENSSHGFNQVRIGKNIIMISDSSFTMKEIENTVREVLMDCAEYHSLSKKL